MLKAHNRNTKRRREICSNLTIKTPEWRHQARYNVFIVNFTYFTRYSSVFIVNFEQVNVGQELVLWICIYPREERSRSNAVIALPSLLLVLNIFYTLLFYILLLVFLLLVLRAYLIDGFDILYFSRF